MPAERLDTAAVFEQVFAIYRRQARVLVPIAFVVFLPPLALSLANGVTARALALAVLWIADIWYLGLVVLGVQDIENGTPDLTIGARVRSVGPVLGPLVWTALLIALGVICGLFFFIVPALVLGTRWSVAPPIVAIERQDPMTAIRRSRQLVRGNGWQVFGVLVVTGVIVVAVNIGVLGTAQAISGSTVVAALASLVGSALTAPLAALASAVLYLNLRRPTD